MCTRMLALNVTISTSAPLSPSDLDNLATFHLHQLAEVLLEEAGVGAPLQQAEQVH